MKESTLKSDLHEKIEHADPNQLKVLYGLITNYFNGQEFDGGWDTLSPLQQKRITKSIEQADAGLGISAQEAIQKTRGKFGLNG
jgi:hypothetical protein